MAWARRVSASKAADAELLAAAVVACELEMFSMPTPNVLTSFLMKLSVCGVIVASLTALRLSNEIA